MGITWRLYKLNANVDWTTLTRIVRPDNKEDPRKWKMPETSAPVDRRVERGDIVFLIEIDFTSFWEPVVILLLGEETVFYTLHLFNKEFEAAMPNTSI